MKKSLIAIIIMSALLMISCGSENAATTESSADLTEEKQVENNVEKKAVLIGGGANNSLNEKIISLCGKSSPKVLVFATASGDDMVWIDSAKSYFTPYSDDVKAIKLINPDMTDDEIRAEILASDIIYVTGGTTELLMRKWEEHSLTDTLKEAYDNGTLMCGSSAGGICWSYMGFNDFDDGSYDFIGGIDIIPIWFGPHYTDAAESRWGEFDSVLSSKTLSDNAPTVGYTLTNGAALICINGEIEIFKSGDEDRVFKFEKTSSGWTKEEVE